VLANGEGLLQAFAPHIRSRIERGLGEGGVALHPRITESHAELSFMTRSFFFIYLGVIFEWPGMDFRMWLAIALVTVAVIAAREVSVHLVGWTTRVSGPNRALLAAMLPRGLATAVLAAMLVDRSNPKETSWETLATSSSCSATCG